MEYLVIGKEIKRKTVQYPNDARTAAELITQLWKEKPQNGSGCNKIHQETKR
jgi:hypothetical protein